MPTGAYLVLRLAVFGDWLPNTARAKSQGLPSLEGLNRPAELISYAGWFLVLLAVVAAVLVVRERTADRAVLATLLVPLGLAVAAFAGLEGDLMPQARFATPVWPLAAVVANVAVSAVLSVLH